MNFGEKESKKERKGTGSEAECIREECVRKARKKEGKQGKVLANECASLIKKNF